MVLQGVFIPLNLTKFIAVLAFIFHIPTMLDYLCRVEYTVHNPVQSIVVISGASSGIGKDSAFDLASQGYYVYAGVRKSEDIKKLNAIASEKGLGEKEGVIHPVILDVTKPKDVTTLVNAVQKQMLSSNRTSLAAVVNNAGISRKNPVEFHEMDDVRRVFETNYFGVLNMIKGFLPLLRSAKSGRIVQISSIAGFISTPGMGTYSSTKFALESISDALRREIVDYNIGVSLVEPGFVISSIHEKVVQNEKPSPKKESTYPRLYSEKVAEVGRESLELAATTECTNDAIRDAIMNKFPKTRYRVANARGIPASMLYFLNWILPDKVFDFLIASDV